MGIQIREVNDRIAIFYDKGNREMVRVNPRIIDNLPVELKLLISNINIWYRSVQENVKFASK